MKKYAGRMLFAVCLALAVAAVWQGMMLLSRAGCFVQHVTLLLQDPLDAKTAETMRELEQNQEEPVSFTAWREEREQVIQAEETGKSTKAGLLWLFGSSEMLLPYGKNLPREDTKGCLVDADTAQELFGSHKVEGMTILAGGQVRVIRGVISSPKRLVILQDTGSGQAGFIRITLQRSPGQPVKALGETFLMRHNLNGSLLRWDLSRGFEWTAELVPGKWSDFSGWAGNLKEKSKELELLTGTEKSTLELEYLRLQKRGVLCLLTGGVLIWGEVLILLHISDVWKKG